MKKLSKLSLITTAIVSTLFVSQAALAQTSANFGATTNYMWRGVSQSDDTASIFGGIDYVDDSGFYAGMWIGSLSSGLGSESDFYLGFSGESGDFTYDVGYVYYVYTELDDSDFGEVYLNGEFKNFGFGLAYTLNSQVDEGSAFDSGDIYYHISYGGIDLGNEFELSLTAGVYTFDADAVDSYSHFQADISKGEFTVGISKATDDNGIDDDIKFIASWTTSF